MSPKPSETSPEVEAKAAEERATLVAIAERVQLRAVSTEEHPEGVPVAEAPTSAIEAQLRRKGLI